MPSILMVSLNADPAGPAAGLFNGGQAKTVREIANWLDQSGWQVTILTLGPTEAGKESGQLNSGVKLKRMPLQNGGAFDYDVDDKVIDSLPPSALTFCEPHEFETVAGFYWSGARLACALAEAWTLPVTIFPCSYGLQRKNGLGRIEPYRVSAEKEAFQAATRIVATNQAERTLLLQEYGVDAQKISLIPRGIDLSTYRPMRTVLFVGRGVESKGVTVLLEAAKLVNADDWRLVLAGPENPRCEHGTSHKQGPEYCWLGPVKAHKVPKIMQMADIVCVPSLYETFGNVALEAISCGKPVIASAVGGLPELVLHEKTGLLVPPNDPIALADAITRLLNDAPLRLSLGMGAREHAMPYDKSQTHPRIEELFSHVRFG